VRNPEADRRELIKRLTETVTAWRIHRFVPVLIIRQEMIEMAFQAMADCGRFNRQWPQMRIEPIAE
jgi:hypothetical protein